MGTSEGPEGVRLTQVSHYFQWIKHYVFYTNNNNALSSVNALFFIRHAYMPPPPCLQGSVCVKGGAWWSPSVSFCCVTLFNIFSRSIDSPLFSIQDKMVSCQLWRHMRPFVRITAIMDPPSWIFCQSPPLLQNYSKLILKYTRKINYQKNNQTKNFKTKSSLFRLTCLSKLGCHSNVTCHIKTIPVPLPPPLPRAKMTKACFSFSSWGRGRSKNLLF